MLSDKRFLTVALIFCFVAIDLNAQDKLERFYATPAFGKAKEVWTQRLDPSVTYEELHKILGDFAARQQNFFESYTGEKAIIGFEIRPYKHGKMTYTRIVYNPLAK